MSKILLAAAAALTMACAPALAQNADCPPGTDNEASNSPVTCDNDDNNNDTTNMQDDASEGTATQQGDSVLDNTNAGQGVKDTVTDAGDGKNNNNN